MKEVFLILKGMGSIVICLKLLKGNELKCLLQIRSYLYMIFSLFFQHLKTISQAIILADSIFS